MPFTLAHPALVIPLSRWPRVFSLAGLVVGAMSPDFEYFVWMQPKRTIGHDITGVLLLCLPSSLALLWVFDRWIKRPLVEIAPDSARARLPAFRQPLPFRPGKSLLRLVVSILVGAYSHLAWDAFTHQHGWFVERIPILQAEVLRIGNRSFAVWNLLQHGCSLIGLALIFYWCLRWLRDQKPPTAAPIDSLTPLQRGAWLAVLLVFPPAFGFTYTLRVAVARGSEVVVQLGVILTITAGCCAVVVYSAWYHLAKREAAG